MAALLQFRSYQASDIKCFYSCAVAVRESDMNARRVRISSVLVWRCIDHTHAQCDFAVHEIGAMRIIVPIDHPLPILEPLIVVHTDFRTLQRVAA